MRALLFLMLASCAAQRANAPAETHALPFIDDDYSRAIAAAQKNSRPIFVETWAPW